MNTKASPQEPNLKNQSTKKLFQLVDTPDAMQTNIPAKTPIDPSVANLSYEQLCTYLESLGYKAKPTETAFQDLKKCAESKEKTFNSNYILLQGNPYYPAKPATIKWLNPLSMPKDLVRPGIPFGIIKQASDESLAKNIYGQELPKVLSSKTPEKKIKKITITTHPSFSVDENGEIKCEKGGRAIIGSDGKIDFSEVYEVKDVRPDQIHKVTFPCSVVVKCDLQGLLDWTIQGDLTVEQFWTAGNIKVQGNVIAKGGVQTNNSHDEKTAIKINGNLEVSFIQSSCFIVEGNIKVAKAILASHLTVTGNLECTGSPGKIAGSEIIMHKGTINANIIGSEKEKPTLIKYTAKEDANNSKVGTLSEGTRIQIGKSRIIIKFDQPWPTPKK